MKLSSETSADEFTATELDSLFGRSVKPTLKPVKRVIPTKRGKSRLIEEMGAGAILWVLCVRLSRWVMKHQYPIVFVLMLLGWFTAGLVASR